jgi:hypothetical protein
MRSRAARVISLLLVMGVAVAGAPAVLAQDRAPHLMEGKKPFSSEC